MLRGKRSVQCLQPNIVASQRYGEFMKSSKLTPKQAAFVREFLVDRNGTQAAIRAGYSKKTAGQIAEQNLKKLVIKEAVEAGEQKHAERCSVTIDTIKRMMDEDRELARKLEQPGPAVTTTMNMAKLFGLITDKAETEVKGKMVVELVRFTDAPPK